jgi:hypothetical protein
MREAVTMRYRLERCGAADHREGRVNPTPYTPAPSAAQNPVLVDQHAHELRGAWGRPNSRIRRRRRIFTRLRNALFRARRR